LATFLNQSCGILRECLRFEYHDSRSRPTHNVTAECSTVLMFPYSWMIYQEELRAHRIAHCSRLQHTNSATYNLIALPKPF